jgi:putative ABC transport system permease protein
MLQFIFSIFTQAVTFLPLAFAITISYHLLRATDMTIDGSFVIGAGVFAKLIVVGVSPALAAIAALSAGACCGVLTAIIQRKGHVDPLLAGIIAVFMLSSINLLIMGKPNINLLNETTLVSSAFSVSDTQGYVIVSLYSLLLCGIVIALLSSRFGLQLRALGDNPTLLKRLGKPVELLRTLGFALTNTLAAGAGLLTAQTVGYADISMGFGMTLTGIGAIILGEQLLRRIKPIAFFRMPHEFASCLFGILLYFVLINGLLRLDVNPSTLKLVLGLILIFFLRSTTRTSNTGLAS